MLGIQEEERKSMYFQCRKYSKDMLIFIVADIWNCYNGYEEKDKLKIQGETKMIVFWIIGILFLIVGLIVSVPNLIKFIKCKEHTTGKIVSIDSSSNGNARAVYEYIVSSSKYTNKTNWTPQHIFHLDGECHVIYDKNNPDYSYAVLA